MWKWLLFLNGLTLATMTAARRGPGAGPQCRVGSGTGYNRHFAENDVQESGEPGGLRWSGGTDPRHARRLFRADGGVLPQPGDWPRFQKICRGREKPDDAGERS